ncbi:hypothetical protein GF356_10440, partial [candidate division GN15 bacterium]|nr:hypothetical protein [candidate division GN15 bacterium]
MPTETAMTTQAKQLAHKATARADEYVGFLEPAREWIIINFGETGLIAAYLLLASIVLLVVAKLSKVAFSTLKYVAIPALILAFIGSVMLDY